MPSCHAIPKCMHIFHDDAHCRHPCDLPPSLPLCPGMARAEEEGASGDSDYYMVRSLKEGRAWKEGGGESKRVRSVVSYVGLPGFVMLVKKFFHL